MFKKYFFIFLLALIIPSQMDLRAATDPANCPPGTDLSSCIAGRSGYAPANAYSLSQTVGKIIQIALGLVGTIFLVLTVYAGFLWMTAAGEEAKIEKAVGIIKTAVIGLAVILAAYSITYFVMASLAKATL